MADRLVVRQRRNRRQMDRARARVLDRSAKWWRDRGYRVSRLGPAFRPWALLVFGPLGLAVVCVRVEAPPPPSVRFSLATWPWPPGVRRFSMVWYLFARGGPMLLDAAHAGIVETSVPVRHETSTRHSGGAPTTRARALRREGR